MVTAVKVAALFLMAIAATTATPTPIADAHGALSTVTLTIRHAAVTSGVYGWMLDSLRCRNGMGWGWWALGCRVSGRVSGFGWRVAGFPWQKWVVLDPQRR